MNRDRPGSRERPDWITITADAAYYVDDGVDVILCDRLPRPVTLVLKNAALQAQGGKAP